MVPYGTNNGPQIWYCMAPIINTNLIGIQLTSIPLFNPFPIGTCQCNYLHGVHWCQQIAEAGWSSQWTLSRQYSPLHYQLLGQYRAVQNSTADSGEDCTVWIESTVTSILALISVGTSEHRGGNCTGRYRLGTGCRGVFCSAKSGPTTTERVCQMAQQADTQYFPLGLTNNGPQVLYCMAPIIFHRYVMIWHQQWPLGVVWYGTNNGPKVCYGMAPIIAPRCGSTCSQWPVQGGGRALLTQSGEGVGGGGGGGGSGGWGCYYGGGVVVLGESMVVRGASLICLFFF